MRRMDKQQIMIILLAAGLLAGFMVFRYVPIIRTKLAAREQVDRCDSRMSQVQTYAQSLPELRRRKEQLTGQLGDYSVRIPENKQFAQLWQQIADVMNNCQLTDQVVQPGAEKQTQQLNCMPLTIECRGSFEQMFSFFQAMEKLDRLVRMEEIDLQNSSEYDATMKLNARATVYYQPGPDNG